MGNSLLLTSIRHAFEAYRKREISVADLQNALENNGAALEGLNRAAYARMHDFSNELERIQFACLLDRQYEETCRVIERLEEYLREIEK